ncbi:MAG: agmatine deiminase family protein [Lentisphaeraceae bacterium]|nr:agmatine deiminase family protein [Lentisphaeraceae bacterium]
MSNLTMPPEWAPQTAVWFAWPANKTWWPGNYEKVSNRFAAMISKVSNFTKVKLICTKTSQKDAEKKIFQSCPLLTNIEFVDYETDDVWCRDFGPIFVFDEQNQQHIVNWQFNAWGAKFPNWQKDNSFPLTAAKMLSLPVHSPDIILEGGAIDVNGSGTLITTEEVLLNPNRNSGLSKKDYEAYFEKYLGIKNTVWLKRGLHNDDTDGHIDNLARFVNGNTIVIASESDPASPNYENLQENLAILKKTNCNIIEIPLPDPIYFEDEMLPASYINFLITNSLVLIPSFSQKEKDQQALNIFKSIFPNHTVEALDCIDFLQEGGAIHCLSQQQPKA